MKEVLSEKEMGKKKKKKKQKERKERDEGRKEGREMRLRKKIGPELADPSKRQ